ncbi:hypothetical protein [Mucilaginibacter sp.]|uniref:hypothetical protein n=1 Tax=Mucilaginibacter sp. TaxID=1882438 RepID=UPI003567A237
MNNICAPPEKLDSVYAGFGARKKNRPHHGGMYGQAMLPADDIARLQQQAPEDIIGSQQAFAGGEEILN